MGLVQFFIFNSQQESKSLLYCSHKNKVAENDFFFFPIELAENDENIKSFSIWKNGENARKGYKK